jgi:hypothetical protein
VDERAAQARRQVSEAAAEGFREIEERAIPFQGLVGASPRPAPVDVPAGVESWAAEERGPRAWSRPPPADEPESLSVQPREISIRLKGRCHARVSLLAWAEGDIRFSPLNKRFGGEPTQHGFGSGGRAMAMLEGEGRAILWPREGEFWALRHQQGAAYLAEDLVCAFSDTSSWENGRLTADGGGDLPIFHLFGPATVVLNPRAAVRRVPLEGKVLLPAARLAGWSGNLVPRLLSGAPPLSVGLWLELNGAGEVFLLEG